MVDLTRNEIIKMINEKPKILLILFGGVNLSGSNLEGVDLSGLFMFRANLRNTDLRGAIIKHTDLRFSDMRDAKLAFYPGAFKGTKVFGANLRGAELRGWIEWGMIDRLRLELKSKGVRMSPKDPNKGW